jgi:hypothetical protein
MDTNELRFGLDPVVFLASFAWVHTTHWLTQDGHVHRWDVDNRRVALFRNISHRLPTLNTILSISTRRRGRVPNTFLR